MCPMDEELRELLISWQLPESVLTKFAENDIISLEVLKNLQVEDVAHLLTLGQKILFRSKLQSYHASLSAPAPVIIEVIQSDAENIGASAEINQHETVQPPVVDLNVMIGDSGTANQENPEGEPSGSKEITSQPQGDMSKKTPNRNSPRTSQNSRSKSIGDVVVRDLFGSRSSTVNFREFLEANGIGLAILRHYEKHGSLTNAFAQKLVHLVINNELQGDHTKKIPNQRLDALAEMICKQFPSEDKKSWYSPFVQEGKKKVCAGGKLYNFYNNERKLLRNAGVIQGKRKKSNNAVNPSAEESRKFLEKSGEPFDTAFAHWENCREDRLQLLHDQEGCSPTQYMEKFICLRSNLGYKYLEADYNHLYPGTTSHLFDKWPQWRERIIKYHSRKAEREPLHKKLLQEVDLYDLPEDDNLRTIAGFKLVSLLLFPKNVQGPKKSWKPATKSELLDYCFMNVPSFADLISKNTEKVNKFAEFGLTVQPFPAVVKTLENCKFYVCVNNVFYRVESAVRALDIVYKACVALHADYPHEVKFSYIFLQQVLFLVTTQFDGSCSMVKKFMKNLEEDEKLANAAAEEEP